MKVRQISDNLWQLTQMWVINCYLVGEDDGLTVVDTGNRGAESDIMAAAAAIGRPITRIGLTHAHVDHAGSLDALAAAVPDAEIALGARSADFLRGALDLHPDEPAVKLRGGFVTAEVEPTRLLQPGDMLGSLTVVSSPGHSPDHIAFYDTRDGSLIAGDAFQTQGGVAVAGVMRWRFPLPAFATWHRPTALASAHALRALNPSRLAVGHGPVLESPAAAMDKAIRVAEVKLNVAAAS